MAVETEAVSHAATEIDAASLDGLLAVAGDLDRRVTAWLDGLGEPTKPSGRRLLYVTFATESYSLGLHTLSASLREHSSLPLLVLTVGDWHPDLAEPCTASLPVPAIFKSDLGIRASRFRQTLTKLWAFGLVSIDRIVFLDADCLVREPIDDLFDTTGFAAAPDLLSDQSHPVFNSGVFAFSPYVGLRDSLFRALPLTSSFDSGDQGLLNTFFAGKVNWLPARDNYLRSYALVGETEPNDARILHYGWKKPWDIKREMVGDRALLALEDVWTQKLPPNRLMELIMRWRRQIADAEIAGDRAQRELRRELRKTRRSGTLIGWILAALLVVDIGMRLLAF